MNWDTAAKQLLKDKRAIFSSFIIVKNSHEKTKTVTELVRHSVLSDFPRASSQPFIPAENIHLSKQPQTYTFE